MPTPGTQGTTQGRIGLSFNSDYAANGVNYSAKKFSDINHRCSKRKGGLIFNQFSKCVVPF
jgi:hypothetical protein